MELAETIYIQKADSFRIKEVNHFFSNVSDKDLKNLDKIIRRHYFHFGLLGSRKEEKNTIIYKRWPGKSYVSLYHDNNGNVEIMHFYPDCSLDQILDLKAKKVSVEN